MLNPIEKFKVAILHLKRDWNHCTAEIINGRHLTSMKKYLRYHLTDIARIAFMFNGGQSPASILSPNFVFQHPSCIC